MMLRMLRLAIVVPLLCGATNPPPVPEVLQPYVTEAGIFDPGDYSWMRGLFEDATPQQTEAYRAINEWADACFASAQERLRGHLAAAGFPEVDVSRLPVGASDCLYFRQLFVQDRSSFATFEEGLAEARPVADTFLAALRIAEQASAPHASRETRPILRRQLETRTIGEQMARMAFTWSLGMEPDSPQLGPIARSILQYRLSAATSRRDEANTNWLKAVIAERGWPKISEVGAEASSKAWLLVQHADHDPLFQLQALRLMEPLVEQDEVSKQNYAYLYDRVMLKLAGKQRYATQVLCTDGVRRPQPLEDEANVDVYRAEMDLEPVANYIASFNEWVSCEALAENSRNNRETGR